MRNLSFGALIVVVGFVAALPFRKSPPPGMTDADASLATGPSMGLVVTDESVSFDRLVRAETQDPTGTNNSRRAGSQATLPMTSESPTLPPRHPQLTARIPSNAQSSPRRDLRLPLTYDDLAVPLVTPGYVDARFGAVAKAPSSSPAIDPPSTKFERLSLSNATATSEPVDAPFQRFDTQPPSVLATDPEPVLAAKPSIEGRLASDARPAVKKDVADERPRQWIRQPTE